MRELLQTNGREPASVRRRICSPRRRGLCLAGIVVAVLGLSLPDAFAQILRLGSFDLFMSASVEAAYDSNVDDVYPEEEEAGYPMADFYWLPGLSLRSQPVGMSPHTSLDIVGEVAYMDYLERDDLDTELYGVNVNFRTTLPRLTLSGTVGTEFSAESTQDEFRPGGAKRDPMRTDTATAAANFNYRKFRAETSWDFTRERHANEADRDGDNDETILSSGVYLDLFTWGSLFYKWENTVTTLVRTDEETDETVETFGLEGAIPFSLLRRPKITYSFGFSYEDETTTTEDSENEKRWEPVHTLTVSDEFQLSRTIQLSGRATWENSTADDEVTFLYEAILAQELGTKARHALTFTREPRATFGSTAETETTTYGYAYSVDDLFIYNLSMNAGVTYEENTTLGSKGAVVENEDPTEKTTTVDFRLNHTRQLSRRLARDISYVFSLEDSNRPHDGPKQKHLLTYGFTYEF